MDSRFKALIKAAVLAPSGDNTQPWRFVVDDKLSRIDIHLDPVRDPSPMNSGQRMARIAIGAALENLVQTAQFNHWPTQLEEPVEGALATIRLLGEGPSTLQIEPKVLARVTNRRPYDGRPLPKSLLEELGKVNAEVDGVITVWITDRDRLGSIAGIIGEADGLMFGQKEMRRAFLSNVRFDAPASAQVEEGLSLGCLELSLGERFGIGLLGVMPDSVMRFGGILRSFSKKARNLVLSASGICLIVIEQNADLAVGRAMERAWLSLTEHGLSVQPMMSLPVLENWIEQDLPSMKGTFIDDEIQRLKTRFLQAVGDLEQKKIAYLMRIGYALPPSGRTGRRSVMAVAE